VLPADPSTSVCNDVVMSTGGLIPIEVVEDDPGFVRLLDGLRSIGRVVIFDRRGVGLSDPITDWTRPVLDQWADDLAAVVEASEVAAPVVFTWDGYGVGSRFAARYPDLLRLLVLHQPMYIAADEWDSWLAERLSLVRDNVQGRRDDFLTLIAPTRVTDASFREWYARAGRVGASPTTASRVWESVFASKPDDQLLDQIEAPTLVVGRRDNAYWPVESVRAAAVKIPHATLVELDGVEHWPFTGDVDAFVSEIGAFVVGERRLPPPQRLLAAVLFTDLVGSTARAASIGDAVWREVLNRHDAAVHVAVGRNGGNVVKSTGDGVLALLPSASAALRAAHAIRDDLGREELGVRIGIHIGDIDRRRDDVSGLTVHIAARVMSAAGDGEIFVTSSVPMAAGTVGATFESVGTQELKGVPGTWELFRAMPS
jgi:class 3 adenylate cyclase/pimeloyl-ACP methyl ester carboxylesterase